MYEIIYIYICAYAYMHIVAYMYLIIFICKYVCRKNVNRLRVFM